MDLIRRVPSDELTRHLADWDWLPGLDALEPFAVTAFGDVLLTGPDGVWFLDTLEGKLSREWDSLDAAQAALATEEGRDQYLLESLVHGALRHGVDPAPDQVLAFTVPPVIGGELTPENVSALDLVVALSISGQLHRQVKDLPPGTRISGFTVDEG